MSPIPSTPSSRGSRHSDSTSYDMSFLRQDNQNGKPQPLTLHSSRNGSYKPIHSSPLAPSSSSPTFPSFSFSGAFENIPPDAESPLANKTRIAQYKASPFNQGSSSTRSSGKARFMRPSQQQLNVFQSEPTTNPISPLVVHNGSSSPIDQSAQSFLRERFLAQATDRAAKARYKSVAKRRGQRRFADAKSDPFMDDGVEYGMEDDEDEDTDVLDDELYGRLMQNMASKTRHQYLLSYEHDVGSSFDPNMEDPTEWERELNGGRDSNEDIPQEYLDDGYDIESCYCPEDPPAESRHFPSEAEWDAIFDEIPEEVFLEADVGVCSPVSYGDDDVEMDMNL